VKAGDKPPKDAKSASDKIAFVFIAVLQRPEIGKSGRIAIGLDRRYQCKPAKPPIGNALATQILLRSSTPIADVLQKRLLVRVFSIAMHPRQDDPWPLRLPAQINGPEFVAASVREWLGRIGVKTL
jgi:hypothetical protein